MRSRLGYLPFLLLAFSVPLKAQIEPISTLKVQPIPLPGGDIFPPTVLPDGKMVPSYGLYNQFFPGPPNQNPPFDPMNADPHGITNVLQLSARLISDSSAGRSLGLHRGTWLDDNYGSGGHEMREISVSEMRQTVLPKASLVGSGTR